MIALDFLTFDVVADRFIVGTAHVAEGLITVRTPSGRRETTQVGGMPPDALARVLLRELDKAERIAQARRRVPGMGAA